MKLSLYYGVTERINQYGWEETAKYALSLGINMLETIDVPFSHVNPVLKDIEEVRECRKLLSSLGVSVSCCSVFANIYKSPETVNYLKNYSEFVSEIGSPFLHHTLLPWIKPGEEVPETSEALECAIDAAEQIAKHAAKFGVTCLYEDQGLIVNGIDGYRAFLNELKRRCSNVGVCGDTGNSLFVDVAPHDFISEFIDDIKHVHVKDYSRFPSNPENKRGWFSTPDGSYITEVNLGEGICEIGKCLDVLKSAGYDDVVSIESPYTVPAIEYMKKHI